MFQRNNLLFCLAALAIGAGVAIAQPTLTSTVQISPRPVAVAVDRSTHQVFVADAELGAVVQYDGARGALVGSIPVGGAPASLAVDSTGGRVFVGNRALVSNTTGTAAAPAVMVVDIPTGRAQSFLSSGRRVGALGFD